MTGTPEHALNATVRYDLKLTDEDDVQSGISNVDYSFLPDGQNVPFGANMILPQPRTFGARLRYRF